MYNPILPSHLCRVYIGLINFVNQRSGENDLRLHPLEVRCLEDPPLQLVT